MSDETAADALYALPPEQFTAARAAAAKADPVHAKALSALRKPTAGAWVVNALARADRQLLDQLLALGPALAAAQAAGSGAELRALSTQRRELLAAVTDRAFEVAQRPQSAATRADVESTLDAALADPATADAVRSGRLTHGLSYVGFGGVGPDSAVDVSSARRADPAVGTSSAAVTRHRNAPVAAAQVRAQDAAGELDDAVRRCQLAQQRLAAALDAGQRAAARVTAAKEALALAKAAAASAQQQARQARQHAEQAAAVVVEAQQGAEQARRALDQLRRG